MLNNKQNIIRVIVTIVAFVLAIILDAFVEMPFWRTIIIYACVYLIISYDVIIRSFDNIIHGQFLDENFLMMIASIGAFAIGDFKEGIAVMIFYQVGEIFQRYAVGKSRASIADLMDIRSDTARVRREGVESIILPEEVLVGDTLIVFAGEKVPVDGEVLFGNTTLDCSALTGESMPVECGVGSNALSGSINLRSVIEIKALKVYADSAVAKILDLIENASNKKAKAENFITKFAKYYTPSVVILAILLSIIPPIFMGGWLDWLHRGLTFLVVSCPCALVISIPMTFFCGIGASSRRGILVKGSNYLELLGKANIFVFDKTGTLTSGEFEVEKVYPAERESEILKLAVIAESQSTHPIAKAICKHANEQKNNGYMIEELAGFGIKASKNDEIIYVGNSKLMDGQHVNYTQNNESGSVVYVAKNGEFVGYILVRDKIKDNAKEVVASLKSNNNTVVMLTGDNEKIADEVAKKVGVSKYYAQLLPSDKVAKIEQLFAEKQQGDIIAFAGDGINDAPVLMRADIGIAMGAVGSDVAIESADVVLMYDDLSSIATAQKIARKTVKIVRQNIVFALAVKAIVLILSAFGIANMWLAVFADVGVAFLAIMNAMRAGKIKDNKQIVGK